MDKMQVVQLARRWFAALNCHKPVVELEAMLDPKGAEMKFPEATLKTPAEFRSWYSGVTHKFFDQQHVMRQIDVNLKDGAAEVFVIVNWQARTWDAPAPASTRIDMDAYQNWVVRPGPGGSPVISRYEVSGMTSNL